MIIIKHAYTFLDKFWKKKKKKKIEKKNKKKNNILFTP